jgi:hypothetical protein
MAKSKGKAYKDKPSKQRYWSEGHRIRNKMRRIARYNGATFLAQWKKSNLA